MLIALILTYSVIFVSIVVGLTLGIRIHRSALKGH